MTKRRKKFVKAISFVILGSILTVLCIFGIICMYISPTFLPVKINGVFVIGNKILRYEIYAFLVVIAAISGHSANRGFKYLSFRFRRYIESKRER